MVKLANASRSLISSGLKMASATFISRILGLGRELLMAATFGASGATDAFTIAFRVPNMLRDLFAEGAFSSAFVPVFTEARLADPQKARRLMWSLVVLLGLVTGCISLGMAIFAPQIVSLVTDERFASDPKRLELTIQLVRLMAPFLVLVSLAALFMGVLNTLKVFFVPSLAPASFNVLMIAAMVLLPEPIERMGFHPIFALGVGVIAGGMAQMLVQIPLIFKKRYGPIGGLRLWSEEGKKIVNRLGIGTLGIAATQINILVTTLLATGTLVGAVSWLAYAFRLFQFPVGILSVSVANSNLVHFGHAWKAGQKGEALELFKSGCFLSLLSTLPASILLFVLAESSVRLVFERGAFTAEDTLMTAKALRLYSLGLVFYGLYKVFVPVFFVLERPKIPVFISMAAVGVNIIFCVLLTPAYGFAVLALGTGVSMALNCCLQGLFLARRLPPCPGLFFNKRTLKVPVAGIACWAVAESLHRHSPVFGETFFALVANVAVVTCGALAAYGLVLWMMGEGGWFWGKKRTWGRIVKKSGRQ